MLERVFLLFAVVTASNLVHAQSSNMHDAVPNQYIVVFKDQDLQFAGIAATGESVRQAAERLVRETKRHQVLLDNRRGINTSTRAVSNDLGFVYEHALKGFSATLTKDAIEFLRKKSEIDYIEPDGLMETSAVQAPTPSWGLDRIDQCDLPLNQSYEYLADGSNVHVYVIDTGIRASHNEFTGRIGNGFDIINNDTDPNDCHGHGTHVSGTIGGTTYGVAKNVTLHAVRVLNCSGWGSTSGVVAGVDWVSANHQTPAIANMSLGGGIQQALDTAVSNLISNGVTTVIAAGNDDGGNACDKSPARVTSAITVASSASNDQRSYFSNIGPCVDIFAPGSAIVSAWIGSDTAISTISGTSMATPHVSGVAALFLEKNPTAMPAEVTSAIINGATPNVIGDAGADSPNRLLSTLLLSKQDLAWLSPIIDLILH